ncbi:MULTISPECIES: SGNH/GDSL hydrolase family protein [Desertifilum]|uniref:SGNH/GDSL hydrolase family protein n=1 Tax=Desertifilum tharense IPPAS B-1220 TaxID=1781255 RepID=A0ACD5GNR7_9CYAN|nr:MULTISPECIES: SGNH/GDSL hydrolase family protein [Desertifilum]MDA0211321.1 SGNH/GDSL hydrolase family protein [Cyanobacteria bacterium FC1]
MTQWLVLLVLWVGVPLLMVELVMIFFEPVLFNKTFYQYDPDMGFRVRPYTLGSNQFGFNDRDYSLEKDPSAFRMLFVGDSFSWAGGQEGNYTALLENQLQNTPNLPPVEVINTGYPMTHTGEQLIVLQKYGLQYNPDLVVLGFFAGNDFIDADPYRKRIVVNDTQIDIDKRREVRFLGYPIIGRSRLVLFVQQKYQVFREMMKIEQAAHANESAPITFSEETFLQIELARMEFCHLEKQSQGYYQANIDYILNSVSQMNEILKARDIQFIVALYPDEFQVNSELQNTLFERFDLNREDYDLECFQKILIEHLEKENIPYLDLLQPFQAASQTQSLYLLRDTHWNAEGNQLAANLLYEYLLKTVDSLPSP